MPHLWAKWLDHSTAAEGGQSQKWPTNEQSGQVTLVVSGIPTSSERETKSEVAHLWAK